jgi:hypothetical protein
MPEITNKFAAITGLPFSYALETETDKVRETVYLAVFKFTQCSLR